MASPSKKRTLSEQKSSDVEAKNSLRSDNNNKKKDNDDGLVNVNINEDENAISDKIDPFRTFEAYLKIKGDSLNKSPECLPQEFQALEDEYSSKRDALTMDILLARLHAIFLNPSTQTAMEDVRDGVEAILNSEPAGEDAGDDSLKELAGKIHEYIKKEITEAKNEWNTEQYQQAFDKLFALTYVGCLEENAWYQPDGTTDKASVEDTLQQISTQWTQMFAKSDKFLDNHLTLGDKHFIYAMMDVIKKCCEEFNCNWNFTKPKTLPSESLNWATEQAKYNAPIITEGDISEDDVEDEHDYEDSENYDDDDVEDGQGEEGDAGAGGEEEATEPPAKKKKALK